jgi:hypothetical protein
MVQPYCIRAPDLLGRERISDRHIAIQHHVSDERLAGCEARLFRFLDDLLAKISREPAHKRKAVQHQHWPPLGLLFALPPKRAKKNVLGIKLDAKLQIVFFLSSVAIMRGIIVSTIVWGVPFRLKIRDQTEQWEHAPLRYQILTHFVADSTPKLAVATSITQHPDRTQALQLEVEARGGQQLDEKRHVLFQRCAVIFSNCELPAAHRTKQILVMVVRCKQIPENGNRFLPFHTNSRLPLAPVLHKGILPCRF